MRGLLVFSCLGTAAHAFAPANFGRAYDYAGRLSSLADVNFKLGAKLEYGDTRDGRNSLHQRRNVLALQDDTQSTLNMILNPVGAVATNAALAAAITGLTFGGQPIPVDDSATGGTRGREKLMGRFSELDTTFYAGYNFSMGDWVGSLALSLFVPVVWKKIDQVSIKDLTLANANVQNSRTRRFVTNNLTTNVQAWGGLDLSAWDKTGVGDITLLLEWKKLLFPDCDYVKRVNFMAQLGVIFPSAQEKDENRAFSMPLGNDGAWSMPFGLGMEMMFPYYIKIGVDGTVEVLFDHTRVRRLKTNVNQTEFFLLNKGRATKRYGLTWQGHAFIEAFHFWDGLSLKFEYQYVSHDKDKLVSQDPAFNNATINALNGLKTWNINNLIFSATYDFCAHRHFHCDHRSSCHEREDDCFHIVPQIQFFYKLAVDGRNLIDNDTVGGQLAFSF